MNRFDQVFFSKYAPEGTKILTVIHKHIIVIADKIVTNYFVLVLLPSFLYYYSDTIKSIIPFFVLEVFLILMFIKGLYDIFDWYNDVWIITDDGVIDLEWKLFSSNTVSVKYDGIEGLELVEKGFLDSLLGKADIIIHKIGGNEFLLEDAANAFKCAEIIDKRLRRVKKNSKEEDTNQDFETVLSALKKVVEGYMEENGYKKDDSKEKEALIKEIKKQGGVIDLTR